MSGMRSRGSIPGVSAALTALLLTACTSGPAEPENQPAEPESQRAEPRQAATLEGLISDRQPVPIPRMAKPAPLVPYTDPAFGTQVTRISSAERGEIVKPMYNTIQAWNADESLLMLYHSGNGESGHHLYDGQTYEYLRALDIAPRDLEQVYWDTTDAEVFYYLSTAEGPTYGKFIRHHVDTDRPEILRDVSGLCDGDVLPTAGDDPQMPSWDSGKLGLRCPSEPASAFFYDLQADTVSESVDTGEGSGYSGSSALAAAPSGERLFLEGDVLSAAGLDLERRLDVTRYDDGLFKPEHATFGRAADGDDAYYSVVYDPPDQGCEDDSGEGIGALVEHNLRTGACRVLIGESNGYGYPVSGVHHSALAYHQPGRVAVSNIGYGQFEFFENDRPAPLLVSEIVLAVAEPEGEKVYRVAHARTYGKDATNGGYEGYFGEPHPVLSPSGTRILFGSDWYDSGSVDTYVIDLPD